MELAALRRVIVRAIDAGAPMQAPAAKIERPSPKSAPLSKPVKVAPVLAPACRPIVYRRTEARTAPRDDVVCNDIAVCFDPPSVTFAGKSVEVSYRQAELVAILAGVMTAGWLDRKIAAQKAWPDLAVASALATISELIVPLTQRLARIGVRFTSERGFGLRLSVAERAAS